MEENSELILLLKEILSELRTQNSLLAKTEPILISKSKTAHLLDISMHEVDRLTREGILIKRKVGTHMKYDRRQVLQAVGINRH